MLKVPRISGHSEAPHRLPVNADVSAHRFEAISCRQFTGAGQRSAILYSPIVSCQRHGKAPMVYMKDLLTRLPRMTNRDDLSALTPSRPLKNGGI